MFVAVYRWRVKTGREDEFAHAWARVTVMVRSACGSGGSALFRGDDGTYTAIARWPDRETRDRCSAAIDADLARMKECVDERFPEQRLDCVTNLWDS